MKMFKLDAKTKDYIFKNMINGCKTHNFEWVASFDKLGNINALKITNNNIDYNITDIGIMGVSLLVKEDDRTSALWNILKLFDFIKNNNRKDKNLWL